MYQVIYCVRNHEIREGTSIATNSVPCETKELGDVIVKKLEQQSYVKWAICVKVENDALDFFPDCSGLIEDSDRPKFPENVGGDHV